MLFLLVKLADQLDRLISSVVIYVTYRVIVDLVILL
jgi:hypothetical protein